MICNKLRGIYSNLKVEMNTISNFTIFFFFFRAIPGTYGGSQARDRIGAEGPDLCHSHTGSEP